MSVYHLVSNIQDACT